MTTISDFFESTYLPRKIVKYSASTVRLYRVAIRHFDRFVGRPAILEDLTDATVSRFLAARLAKVSAFTANRDVERLLSLWRWAAAKKHVRDFPDVEFAIEPVRIPRAWSREELHRLFQAVNNMPGYVGKITAKAWWRALLFVLFDTGERISAVLGLDWSDVDLETQWVVCRAEHRKGRKADRSYRIAADTAAALATIPHRKGRVFQWNKNISMLWTDYGKILLLAGLPNDRRSKFHKIRRSTASHAKAAGANPQELLGHSNPRVTAAYLDPAICGEQQAVDYLFRPGI